MHHLIFILPVLGLAVFWVLPPAAAVPVYAVIVAVSVASYVVIIRAKRRAPMMGEDELEHEPAVVVSVLGAGEAEVRVHGELWHAVSDDPLAVGARVDVVSEPTGMTVRVALHRDSAGASPPASDPGAGGPPRHTPR